MNTKYAVSIIFIVCSVTASYGMYPPETTQSTTESYWAGKRPITPDGVEAGYLAKDVASHTMSKKNQILAGLACGTASHLAGLFFAYKGDPSFAAKVDQTSEEAKHMALRNLVLPLHLRVSKIKDSGLTRKDLAIGACGLACAYGIKKVCDYFWLGHAIRGDVSNTKKAAQTLMYWMQEHKKKWYVAGFGRFVS